MLVIFVILLNPHDNSIKQVLLSLFHNADAEVQKV